MRGRVVHAAVDTVGSFVASKQILEDIQKLIRWSQQYLMTVSMSALAFY